MEAVVQLGITVLTPDARDVLHAQDIRLALRRHALGDWGELDDSDRKESEEGLKLGLRIVSLFRDRWGQKFYVITEADRSVTRVVLPSGY